MMDLKSGLFIGAGLLVTSCSSNELPGLVREVPLAIDNLQFNPLNTTWHIDVKYPADAKAIQEADICHIEISEGRSDTKSLFAWNSRSAEVEIDEYEVFTRELRLKASDDSQIRFVGGDPDSIYDNVFSLRFRAPSDYFNNHTISGVAQLFSDGKFDVNLVATEHIESNNPTHGTRNRGDR